MKQYALLATKEENYEKNIKRLVVGNNFEYPTTRRSIIEKLNPEDIILIRIQGTADIPIVTKLISMTGTPGNRVLTLQITNIIKPPTSAKELFHETSRKAGAEHGWIKGEKAISWIERL